MNITFNHSKNKTCKKKFPSRIRLYSNVKQAQKMAYKYLGKKGKLCPATKSVKKYSIYDSKQDKWINFGQMGYEDYTKHRNKTRRKNYLTRARSIKGNWKKNKYSPNNLAQHILW